MTNLSTVVPEASAALGSVDLHDIIGSEKAIPVFDHRTFGMRYNISALRSSLPIVSHIWFTIRTSIRS